MASLPEVYALIGNFFKRVPVKLLCYVLVVTGIVGGNWYVFEYVQTVEASGRCSSDYPNFGVILDNAVTLDDGSIQAEGTVYPPGAFWEEDGVVRGCPCSLGPCVVSCCPQGYILKSFTHKYQQLYGCTGNKGSDQVYEATDMVEEYYKNGPLQSVDVRRNHFSTVVRDSCTRGFYMTGDNLTLLNDGRIWNKAFSRFDRPEFYCFHVDDGTLLYSTPLKCYESLLITKVKLYYVLKHAFVVPPMLLHAGTFVAFLLVPQLREGCGIAIMNYVAAQFFKKFILIYYNEYEMPVYAEPILRRRGILHNHWSKDDIGQYYFQLLAEICQLVIVFQIRFESSPRRAHKPDHNSWCKTIFCVVLSWGISLVWTMTSIIVSIDYVPQLIAYHGRDTFIQEAIFTLPLVVLELANLLMCATTLGGLRDSKKRERMQGSDNQRPNSSEIQWSILFMKMSLITGVDYILLNMIDLIENFSFAVQEIDYRDSGLLRSTIPWFVRTTLQSFSDIKGVEIFLIFVFKIEVWTFLRRRFYVRKPTKTPQAESKQTQGIVQPQREQANPN